MDSLRGCRCRVLGRVPISCMWCRMRMPGVLLQLLLPGCRLPVERKVKVEVLLPCVVPCGAVVVLPPLLLLLLL